MSLHKVNQLTSKADALTDYKSVPFNARGFSLSPHITQQVSPDQVKQIEQLVLSLLDNVGKYAPGQLGEVLKNISAFGHQWLEQDWVVNLFVSAINFFEGRTPTKAELLSFVQEQLA